MTFMKCNCYADQFAIEKSTSYFAQENTLTHRVDNENVTILPAVPSIQSYPIPPVSSKLGLLSWNTRI